MKCSFKKLSIIIMIFPCFNNDFDQIYIGHTFLHLDASIEKLCTSFPIKHITIVNHESIYCICFSLVEGSDVLKQMGLLSTIQQSHRHIMLRLIVTSTSASCKSTFTTYKFAIFNGWIRCGSRRHCPRM